jgi:hypothetical protein
MKVVTRRLAWMAVGGAVALATRSRFERAVAVEARRLHDRLPTPAARVVDRLPGDLPRATGAAVVGVRAAYSGGRLGYRTAVVGGRAASGAAVAASRTSRAVSRAAAGAAGVAERARAGLDATRAEWHRAAADEERRLRAELALLHGEGVEVIPALVDRRPEQAERHEPPLPPPVPAGRPTPPMAAGRPARRVQRSYRRASGPW